MKNLETGNWRPRHIFWRRRSSWGAVEVQRPGRGAPTPGAAAAKSQERASNWPP